MCFDNYKQKILKCNRAKRALCRKHTSFASFEIASAAAEDARASALVHIYGHVHIKAVYAAGLNISLFYSTFSSQTTDSRDFISVARTLQSPVSGQ